MTLALEQPPVDDLAAFTRPLHEDYAVAWLASFRSQRTIDAYRTGITQWFDFCGRLVVDPLDAMRAHVDLFMHHLEVTGKAPRTRALRLTTISSFYTYLLDEELVRRNPTRKVLRPKYPRKSPTAWLTRGQIFDLVTTAEELGAHPFALVSLLAYNGPHGRITPHSLRHSAASLAMNSGANQDQVMHDFGWSSPAMLGHYTHGHENPARSSTHLIAASVLGVG